LRHRFHTFTVAFTRGMDGDGDLTTMVVTAVGADITAGVDTTAQAGITAVITGN
jgi:hypothetical protein